MFIGNEQDLLNIPLDTNGNICNENTKIFDSNVLKKKRQLEENKKTVEVRRKKMKLEQANIIAAGKSLFNLNDTIQLKSSEVYASSSACIPKKGVEIESFFPSDYHSHLLQECYVNMQTAEIHDRPDEYTPLNSSPVNEITYPDDENDEDEDTKLDVEEEIGALHTYLSDIGKKLISIKFALTFSNNLI